MGFGAPLPFDLPTAPSQVTNGDGSQPGGFTDDVELANASYGQAETFVTPLVLGLAIALERRRDAACLVILGVGFFFKLTWAPFFVEAHRPFCMGRH